MSLWSISLFSENEVISPLEKTDCFLTEEQKEQIQTSTYYYDDYLVPSVFTPQNFKMSFATEGNRIKWTMETGGDYFPTIYGCGDLSQLYDIKLYACLYTREFSLSHGDFYSIIDPYTLIYPYEDADYINFTFYDNPYTMVKPERHDWLGNPVVGLDNWKISGYTDGFLLPEKNEWIKWANGSGSPGKNLMSNMLLEQDYPEDDMVPNIILHVKSETNGTGAFVNCSNYNTANHRISMDYRLDTTVVLNSTYYSRQNTKIYYFTEGEYYGSSYYYLRWVESTDTVFQLRTPWYKIRITDLEGNILFEDIDYQDYNIYRNINLDSIRVQNNADEPIHTSLIENEHYQGAYSFDNEILNKSPSSLSVTTSSSTTFYQHYITDFLNHQKVLKIVYNSTSPSGEINVDVPITTTSHFEIEYWAYETTGYMFVMYNTSWALACGIISEKNSFNLYNGTSWTMGHSFPNYGWNHWRLSFAPTSFSIYINQNLIYIETCYITDYFYPRFHLDGAVDREFYIDAIDHSQSTGYYLNRNCNINNSAALYNWNAFPEWESNYKMSSQTSRTNSTYATFNVSMQNDSQYSNHTNILTNDNTGIIPYIRFDFPITTGNSGEFFFKYRTNSTGVLSLLLGNVGDYDTIRTWFHSSNFKSRKDGSTETFICVTSELVGHWNTIGFRWNATKYDIYVNGIWYLGLDYFLSATERTFSSLILETHDWFSSNINFSIASMYASSNTGYYSNIIENDNTTIHMLPMHSNLTLQTNPYANTLSNFTASNYLYGVTDLYGNSLFNGSIYSNQSEIIYTPANVRENFVSIADQQNQYLAWENFRLYLNGTQIYSNRFYREIDESVNISIYSRFGTYLNSTIHTVTRDDNWIPINLTRYCLKIFNQQSAFMHYNITLDPNYYPTSSVFWSEWLAPNEIGKNYLYADNYKVTLMHNETGIPAYESYNLPFNNDDVLLVSSANTIFAVIQNINNLNSSVAAQFNYVSLNFTNTNSRIGNITNIITISFGGENITLENFLLEQMNYFSFISSNLSTIFQNLNNSLFLSNSTMNSLYSLSSNTYTLINDTIQTIVVDTQNALNLIGSDVNSIAALSQNSFLYLNSSINNSITWMAQNFTLIGDDINSNQIEILTQYSILASNITNNSLDIINNLYLVNNSISNLTADLTNNVLLMNNTIYTAMVNISQNLALDSNNILGNLSITFQQNEFLTEIYKKTIFNDLLYNGFNWSAIGYNYSQFTNYVEEYSFVNNYINQSLELFLRYQNTIQSMEIGVGGQLPPITLPSSGVDYRIKSTATGEYLTDWEDLTNTTIPIGETNYVIPATPAEIRLEIKDYLLVALFGVVALSAMAILYIKTKAQLDVTPESHHKTKKLLPGVRDTSTFSGMETQIFRSKKSNSKNSLVIVGAIIVIVFVIVYLLIRFGV
jgi:hypothetical protein